MQEMYPTSVIFATEVTSELQFFRKEGNLHSKSPISRVLSKQIHIAIVCKTV